MNIAICDDDSEIIKIIHENVNRIFEEMNVNVNLSGFANGNDLIAAIQKEKYYFDLLLLDIDMPEISGLEVAKKLRERNNNIIIIFVSSFDHYVFDSLEYSPFRYIRKSRINEELKHALMSAYSVYKKNKKRYIQVKNSEGEYKIELSEILYFEIIKRKLFLHLTDNRVFSVWKTIRDLYNEVYNGCFVKIHSGCVVNMKYIKEYSNHDITLDNGEKLPVSRAGMKVLKNELTRYWSECI